MNLVTITLILFFIMDPVGNVQNFNKALEKSAPPRRRWIVFREMTIALLFILLFALVGEGLYYLFDLSHAAVSMTAGLILFLTAVKILFGYGSSPRKRIDQEEPLVTPLAVPFIAGPSLLAVVMIYAHIIVQPYTLFIAIAISWTAALLILLMNDTLLKLLRIQGLNALEKLTGMLLVLLSVQRFLEGVRLLIEEIG